MIFMKKKNKKNRKGSRKYKHFELNWNFHDKNALAKAVKAVKRWIKIHSADEEKKDFKVRDMIIEINSEMYNDFSRGDKCRVGKAISIMYNQREFPEIERGEKKGATNTYHIV